MVSAPDREGKRDFPAPHRTLPPLDEANTMKSHHHFLALSFLTLIVSLSPEAQTLYVPSGTDGIGTSAIGTVGIGTHTPLAELSVSNSTADNTVSPVLSLNSAYIGYSSVPSIDFSINGYTSFQVARIGAPIDTVIGGNLAFYTSPG